MFSITKSKKQVFKTYLDSKRVEEIKQKFIQESRKYLRLCRRSNIRFITKVKKCKSKMLKHCTHHMENDQIKKEKNELILNQAENEYPISSLKRRLLNTSSNIDKLYSKLKNFTQRDSKDSSTNCGSDKSDKPEEKSDYNKQEEGFLESNEQCAVNQEEKEFIDKISKKLRSSKLKYIKSLSKKLRGNKKIKSQIVIGRWSNEEKRKFIQGILLFGNDYEKISKFISTRTSSQCSAFSQKLFHRLRNAFKKNLFVIPHINLVKLTPTLLKEEIDKLKDEHKFNEIFEVLYEVEENLSNKDYEQYLNDYTTSDCPSNKDSEEEDRNLNSNSPYKNEIKQNATLQINPTANSKNEISNFCPYEQNPLQNQVNQCIQQNDKNYDLLNKNIDLFKKGYLSSLNANQKNRKVFNSFNYPNVMPFNLEENIREQKYITPFNDGQIAYNKNINLPVQLQDFQDIQGNKDLNFLDVSPSKFNKNNDLEDDFNEYDNFNDFIISQNHYEGNDDFNFLASF